MPTSARPIPGTNLAVLVGTLSRPPEPRRLPSGDELVALEVTIRSDAGPTSSVPVAWSSPSKASARWGPGQAVVVVGRVHRRFFRAGGSTQSRVEVVATTVVAASRRAAAQAALAEAARQLAAASAA